MRPAFARFELPAALDAEPRPAWPLWATAQHIVLRHVRRLLSLRQAAWNGEVEAIHRLRVAARRARTALADFAALWNADEVRAARRALARLADGLGEARDLDVLLALVDAELDTRGEAPALRAARTALQGRRDDRQGRLHRALTEFELAGWPARLVTYFASQPFDLWRFVDVEDLLGHDGEGPSDR